jgi:hypothetical protein
MSFSREIMEFGKLGGATFVGYALNRFLSTMQYSQKIMPNSPETGSVLVSSGISLGAIKLQSKIKDKSVKIGLVSGSIAASIHLATRIPTIQNALPQGIVSALSGEVDGEEISGEDLENQINAEVDARIRNAFESGQIQFVKPQLELSGSTNETPNFELSGSSSDDFSVEGEEDLDFDLEGDDSEIYSDLGED